MTTSTAAAPPDQRPADHPQEGEECVVVLGDGRSVRLRPVVPGDLTELRSAGARADPETLRRRFLGGGAPCAQAALRRLVEVDDGHRCALAAVDGDGRGVGIFRYEGERTWPTVEIAVAVDATWRGAVTDVVDLRPLRVGSCADPATPPGCAVP